MYNFNFSSGSDAPAPSFASAASSAPAPAPAAASSFPTTTAAGPVSFASVVATGSAVPPADIVVDDSKPKTQIQIRLGDGSRLVATFNHTHTIADIRQVRKEEEEGDEDYFFLNFFACFFLLLVFLLLTSLLFASSCPLSFLLFSFLIAHQRESPECISRRRLWSDHPAPAESSLWSECFNWSSGASQGRYHPNAKIRAVLSHP